VRDVILSLHLRILEIYSWCRRWQGNICMTAIECSSCLWRTLWPEGKTNMNDICRMRILSLSIVVVPVSHRARTVISRWPIFFTTKRTFFTKPQSMEKILTLYALIYAFIDASLNCPCNARLRMGKGFHKVTPTEGVDVYGLISWFHLLDHSVTGDTYRKRQQILTMVNDWW
jgi:hypothetical protein